MSVLRRLGKTFQSIVTMWVLMTNGVHGTPTCSRTLVLTPSSLVTNWGREVDKWLAGRLKPIVMDDSNGGAVKVRRREDKVGGSMAWVVCRRAGLLLCMGQLVIHAWVDMRGNMQGCCGILRQLHLAAVQSKNHTAATIRTLRICIMWSCSSGLAHSNLAHALTLAPLATSICK